jgi:hypothetical protein
MTINDWDIANADAKLWNVTPGFHSVKNDSEWNEGDLFPTFLKNEIGFKTIKTVLLIKKEGGRKAILQRCSEILSRLLQPADLYLEWFDHRFFGIMTKYTHDEKSMKHWHTLTIEFDGYEYGEEVVQTFSGTKKFAVINEGNIRTPAVIEIVPQVGQASILLTGICRDVRTGEDMPVTVRNLVKDEKISLNGETGLFTCADGNEVADVDIWALPELYPGTTECTSSSQSVDFVVRWRPRYM